MVHDILSRGGKIGIYTRPAGTCYTISIYLDTIRLAKRIIGFDTIMTQK